MTCLTICIHICAENEDSCNHAISGLCSGCRHSADFAASCDTGLCHRSRKTVSFSVKTYSCHERAMRRHGYCQGRPPLKHFRSLWGERGSGGAGDESRRPPRRHKRNLFALLHAEASVPFSFDFAKSQSESARRAGRD